MRERCLGGSELRCRWPAPIRSGEAKEWLVLLRAPSAWRVLVPVGDARDDPIRLEDTFKSVSSRILISDPIVKTIHRTV